MAESRLLVSKYVSENRDENRKIARACNIAKWMIDNFSENAGKRVNIKELRSNIPSGVKDSSLKPSGDLKAHGNAVNVLNLGRLTIGKDTMVDISLPNLKRCASWILGQGQKVGAISLIRDEDTTKNGNGKVGVISLIRDEDSSGEDKNQLIEDNLLIDLAMEIPSKEFTVWESDFVMSLNKKWRERGLSSKQRSTLTRIIKDRS